MIWHPVMPGALDKGYSPSCLVGEFANFALTESTTFAVVDPESIPLTQLAFRLYNTLDGSPAL